MGQGRQPAGEEGFSCLLACWYLWKEGVITQKPMVLVLNCCQLVASVSRAQPHHPPAATLDFPAAQCCQRDETSPGPCKESWNLSPKKHLLGLMQYSNCTLPIVLWVVCATRVREKLVSYWHCQRGNKQILWAERGQKRFKLLTDFGKLFKWYLQRVCDLS